MGGVLPALVWLLFWLREDEKNPEPRRRIRRTFLFGMLAVLLVLPFQKFVEHLFPTLAVLPLFLWALLEEVFKLGAAYFGGIHTKDDNEPIDPLVYMVTAALGFVALENTLFIWSPIMERDLTQSLITGNMRFVGASLLHVVSSGILGLSIALSFYRSRLGRIRNVSLGLGAAIIFHLLFNILIINGGKFGTTLAFTLVWTGVIGLLWAFERTKAL